MIFPKNLETPLGLILGCLLLNILRVSKISNFKFRIVYLNFLPSLFRTCWGRRDTNVIYVTPGRQKQGPGWLGLLRQAPHQNDCHQEAQEDRHYEGQGDRHKAHEYRHQESQENRHQEAKEDFYNKGQEDRHGTHEYRHLECQEVRH